MIPRDTIPRGRSPRRSLAASIALTLTAFAAFLGGRWALDPARFRPEPGDQGTSLAPEELASLRDRAWDRIQPHLEHADSETAAQLEASLEQVRAFFRERKEGTPGFAEAVLSLRGKWRLVKSKMPFTDEEGHRAYLREEFENHVFGGDELLAVVTGAVQSYVDGLIALENQLLVDVRADLRDFPVPAIPAIATSEAFRERYTELSNEVAVLVAADARTDVARETGSFIAGEVAAKMAVAVGSRIATRLGISATILGTGAASSWASFGLTVVAALLVDFAVDRVIGFFYDPEAEIAVRVDETLDNMCKWILEGDDDSDGLAAELAELGRARSRIRRDALQRLILQP